MATLKAPAPFSCAQSRFISRQVGISGCKPTYLKRRSKFQMQSRRTEADLLDLNMKLLESIASSDYETYEGLCADDMTCFEPEALGNCTEGLDFHKWYFELHGGDGHPAPNQTISSPKVRMLGRRAAVVTYIRLQQFVDGDGRPITKSSEETRVWERQSYEWKNVHFHRSIPNQLQ